jgi:hypothetical protein
MTTHPAAHDCHQHLWERYLERCDGSECVVRCCRRCGRKEICWSRRPWPRPQSEQQAVGPLTPFGKGAGQN